MADKVIILLRHGQSVKNVEGINTSALEGYPLTETGRQQALRAAKALSTLPRIDNLYSSPVLRARETAEIVGMGLSLRPEMDGRLRERHWGTLEGKSTSIKEEVWKFDPKYKIEPWELVRSKMAAFIEAAHGAVTVAVTHGDNISSACSIFDGKSEYEHLCRLTGYARFAIIDFANKKVMEDDAEEVPRWLIKRLG